jgi:Phage integrase, N-terminal SAM-like domain
VEQRPKKRLDRGGDPIGLKHYSIRTEESYVSWMKPYIFFYNTRHPNDMASATIEEFSMHWI